MGKQKDREEFVEIMAKEGVPLDVTRALMRAGTSLHRLAERECNGDDWRDERGPRCMSTSQASQTTACGEEIESLKRKPTRFWSMVTCSSCKSAQIEARVRKLLEKCPGVVPIFQGDPRGAVLKVKVPSGRTNDWGQEGVCVP